MKYVLLISIWTLLYTPHFLHAQNPSKEKNSTQEIIVDEKQGFLTCAGGSSVPLFKQDCKALTLKRVSFGGDIRYEGECLDSSDTAFLISCIAYSFEPNRNANKPNPGFFQ